MSPCAKASSLWRSCTAISCRRALGALLFRRATQPAGKRAPLSPEETAAERKCPFSQRLAHLNSQPFDLPNLGAHPPQIATASENRAKNDEVVILTQLGLQAFQIGGQRSDARRERLHQAELIPQHLDPLAPRMERGRLAGFAGVFHRLSTSAIGIRGDD